MYSGPLAPASALPVKFIPPLLNPAVSVFTEVITTVKPLQRTNSTFTSKNRISTNFEFVKAARRRVASEW